MDGISVTHRFLEVPLFTDYKNGDEINLSTLFNFGKVIFTMYTGRTCKHTHTALDNQPNRPPAPVLVHHLPGRSCHPHPHRVARLSHKQNNWPGSLFAPASTDPQRHTEGRPSDRHTSFNGASTPAVCVFF